MSEVFTCKFVRPKTEELIHEQSAVGLYTTNEHLDHPAVCLDVAQCEV